MLTETELKLAKIVETFSNTAADINNFEDYLALCADTVGELVNGYIPASESADINRYLYTPLTRFSQNAGKRHRPLICFAACAAVGGDISRAVSSAAAIEHFH